MKALIVVPSVYCYFAHAVAKTLKDKHGITEFSAFVLSPWAEDFIKSRTDIKYDPILVDHEIHKKIKTETIDLKYLKYFEDTYGEPNGWLALYQDRKLMMSIGPKEESTLIVDPIYDQDDLIKSYQVRARAIEQMLAQAKPDFVLFSFVGNISQILIAQIAKKMGIMTLSIEFCKISNRIALTEDYHTITGLKEKADLIQKQGENNAFYSEARNILNEYMQTGSLKIDYIEEYKRIIAEKKRTPITSRIYKAVEYFIIHWKNYLKYKGLFLYHDTTRDPWRFYYQKLRREFRRIMGIADLYSKPDFTEEYAFYPLHYEPELSIQTLSPFYFNQLTVLEYISRSLPLNYKLYVKDHPQTPFNRPKSYFNQILKLPNVRLIDHRTNSFDIIKNAKIVFTITGTAGFEAALLGKPTITFGDIFYNDLSGVTRIKEIEKLPALIKEKLKNFQVNREETTAYIGAILGNSISMDFTLMRSVTDLDKLMNSQSLNQFCEMVMKNLARETKN